MMQNALKVVGVFVGVVLLLCITIKERTVFTHIYHVISPVTVATQEYAEDLFGHSLAATQRYTKKLFDNSVPKLRDSIKTGQAAPSRKPGLPEEIIKVEEKEELDELIKSHR
jgi:hypothetical protein